MSAEICTVYEDEYGKHEFRWDNSPYHQYHISYLDEVGKRQIVRAAELPVDTRLSFKIASGYYSRYSVEIIPAKLFPDIDYGDDT